MSSYRHEIVNPDPERIIEGLRDTGYQLETSVADIIDNSIAADATVVDVKINMIFDGSVEISFADNGHGMDEEGLINAMRYGSEKRANAASLGKFGLGLKTASTAFCRCLSVISRNAKDATACKAVWDLDHVAQKGMWELGIGEASSSDLTRLNEIAGEGSGTLVVWDKIDRLLKNYELPGGGFAKNALNKNIDHLKEHLSMVYQRFLDPNDARERTVRICLNGEDIEAWDPFCVTESSVVADEPDYKVELNDKEASFSIKAYVIPRKEDFSSQQAAKQARIGNNNQGIYVYRENRLIHGPDWMGMYSKEPHLSQLRIEFSFDHTLDDAFHIDIKKSQILLNNDLYTWLKENFLPAPRRAADQSARLGLRNQSKIASKTTHTGSNNAIHEKAEDLRTANTEVVNADNNVVALTNKNGRIQLKIRVSSANSPGELHVQPVDGILDGLLWEPAIIDGNQAVSLNTGHPYYQKVYLPNRASGVTIQGLDSLMWALCAAELGTISESTKRHFSELRFEVSRLLRALVEDMPDPVLDSDAK